jgi:hypothetical protein
MSFCDTCVAPRYRNGPTGRLRLTGAEAFELEGMHPGYIDIDCFWPKGADRKGSESVPIAIYYYGSSEMRWKRARKSNSGLEAASVML